MKKVFELNKYQTIEVDVPVGLNYSQEDRWSTHLTPPVPLTRDEIEVGQELFLISDCYACYSPILHKGAVVKEIISSEAGDKMIILSTKDDKYFKKGEEREVLLSRPGFANCNESDVKAQEKRCGYQLTPDQYDYWFGYISVYASKEAWNQAIVSYWEKELMEKEKEKRKEELRQQIKDELDKCSVEMLETISTYVETLLTEK